MPVFLASRRKTVGKRIKRKSFFAQLILVLLGVELLFLSGFTAVNLALPSKNNLQLFITSKMSKLYSYLPDRIQHEYALIAPSMIPPPYESLPAVRYSTYVPQAPISIFLGYVLGWPLAVFVLAAYILLGMIGPFFKLYVFAAGSGLNYYLQPGFGYLIGMVVAAGCVGWFSRGDRTSFKQLLCLALGLLCVHGIGLAYLLAICLLGVVHESTGQQLIWSTWLLEVARNLSWYALPYDLILSLGLIGIAFPFRWLVAKLVSPDIGVTEATEGEKLIDFKLAR